MKKVLSLLLAALVLLAVGCGKRSLFGLDWSDNVIKITAEHAEIGSAMVGHLTVGEDQKVSVSCAFDGNGQIRVRLAEGEFTLSDFPESGDVFFASGHDVLSLSCDPGEYTVEVYCVTALNGAGEITAVAEETAESACYAGVTAMDRASVEAFAREVKALYLAEDWAAIAERIQYPIIMGHGEEIGDADAFLAYMRGRTIQPLDREIMEEETCEDLFFNGEGICLGSGQLWLRDPGYGTTETPTLRVIAVSGLTEISG